jgi:hypothetical protein
MGFDSSLNFYIMNLDVPLKNQLNNFIPVLFSTNNRMSEQENPDVTDFSEPPKKHVSPKQPQNQLTMSPRKPLRPPPYITEQEFLSDHISHSSLKSKDGPLKEANDILKLLVGMKMFKDLGGRIY